MPGSILENISDPPLPAPKAHHQNAPLLEPVHTTLPKTGEPITLLPIIPGSSSSNSSSSSSITAAALPNGLVEHLHAEFAAEIERGCTYPMETAMPLDRFREYWFGTFATVVLRGDYYYDDGQLQLQLRGADKEDRGKDWKDVCLGTFYIKPNYPGRCSHVCNAGFLTCTSARGQGVGSVMGKTYLNYAPKLGYKYSVFNLVFENNPASRKIWDKLGFEVIGRVPGAARLANSEELVDALIYGRSLV